MAEAGRPAGRAASAAGQLYPVDSEEEKPEVLEAAAQEYHAKLLKQPPMVAEFFSIPGREKVKIEASSVRFLPLYRQDSRRTLLVLNDPQQKDAVLAIYLHNSWWLIEDVVKTADRSREGLIQVQTFRERIVLFVLNYIIFGMQEKSLSWDAAFLPHSEREYAKLFWRSGEAAGFYTVKAKGLLLLKWKALLTVTALRQWNKVSREFEDSPKLCKDLDSGTLCDEHSSWCYQLPVLDTVFVRKFFRRRGLGTAMLQDFCETFTAEDALGISSPISAKMYQVCRRFLDTRPEEQARLWEVEAPGDWSQRTSVWLTVQLAQRPLKNDDDLGCRIESHRDDEAGHSGDSQMNKGAAQAPDSQPLRDQAEEFKDNCNEPLDSQHRVEEHLSQRGGEVHQCQELKKRVRRGAPAEDRAPKQLKSESYDRSCSS
ncbi:protein FAM169B-like isoform X2 [Paroedura picta]|uniref:protein FAM169B-like isoform X2 n=1 Tax=Paroedura picta TaxID=143630 RepID=UPI004056C732